MTEEIKPEKIKKTQESLLKYIKKPPLTDKLLKKPPFRFLHDIVTSVMKETGFLEGVFSPEELISDNIKDRDAKINFLEKLISSIKSVTGTTISAKPSKIIAGLEVNKTLDLLLALANGVDIKVNGPSKANVKTTASKNEAKDAKKISKSNNEVKTDTSKKKRDDSKVRSKDSKKTSEQKHKGDNKKNESTKSNVKTAESNKIKNKIIEKSKSELPKEPGLEASNILPTIQNKVEEKTVENGESISKKLPPHIDRPPSSDSRVTSKNRKSSADIKVSSGKSKNSEITSIDIKSERQASFGEDKSLLETVKMSSVEPEMKLPDKISLKQIAQISSDSISNSNLSTELSDTMANGNVSPEINGGLTSLEAIEKTDEKPKISNVANRSEGLISKTEQLEKVAEEKERSGEPEKVKLKRPQSAKLRPGSIRQRRPTDDKSQFGEDRVGQVILGQGQSTDVMSSAPITAPSAKGRRILSGRPMSSRPGAPKPKDKGQINISEKQSSEEVKPIAVIEDKQADEEDDAENLVIVEKVKQDDTNTNDPGIESNLDESNQGALVAQILETKKELEDTKRGRWDSPYHQRHNIEIDWETKSRSRRDMLAKEVNNLREGIQTVTRSSNPLGKLFDFLQEDVELMQAELQEWNNTNIQLQKDIHLQNKQTEEILSPLSKQLSDLDLLIDHEQESIRRIKSNIYLNSTKLDNLLKINNT